MPLIRHKKPTISVKSETILRQIRLMETLEAKNSEEATLILSKWLLQGCAIKEILNYYMACQSIRALDLLCTYIQEPFDKNLFDQLTDYLQKNPAETIILLGRLINNGPSWLSKIPSHEIFARLLEILKSGKNLEHVNSVLFLMTSLLPYFPTPNESIVKDLFRCFLDTCKLYYQKNKSALEKLKHAIEPSATSNKNQIDNPFVMSNLICLMQIGSLQTSLKIFFNALYAIYPNSVLAMLQKFIQTNGNTEFFTNVLEPIVLSCRLHPNIIENRDREMNTEKWKERRPDELFSLCEKVSIEESKSNGNNLDFKRQLNDNINDLQIDINSFDSNTMSFFKKGYQNFGMLTKPITRFGLDSPPNEDANLDYLENDYFDNVNFEKFLNNSLTANSNPSITNQPNSWALNHGATDPTCSQKFSNNKSSPKRQIMNDNKLKNTVKSTQSHKIRRSLSLPVIRRKADLDSVQLPFAMTKLLKHTLKSCIKGSGFDFVKNQTEHLRSEYMQEGQKYHERLKILGLTDRLPGKIYDDLHSIMKGLSVENQRDLLESRLNLVNAHLLFERSCRMILTKRSRELSSCLKVNNLPNDYLVNENTQLRLQNEQLNQLLQDLQNDKNKLRAKLDEKDQFYLSKLQNSNAKIDELSIELDSLKHRLSTTEHNSLVYQKRLESMLLEEEQKFAESQVIDAQQDELKQLRYELELSQEQNRHLRERCETLMITQTKHTSNDQLNIVAKNTEAQMNSLKLQLQRSRDLVDEWNVKYEQLEESYAMEFEKRAALEVENLRMAKMFSMQVKSLSHKYDSMLTICTKQEAHIAYLYGLVKKSSTNILPSQKLHSASFKEIFPFEEVPDEPVEELTVDEHLSELFGQENSQKLELIDKQSESLKKTSSYIPSSSLDTFVPIEPRHERRCSLTTLPISEYNVADETHNNSKHDSDNEDNSSKASNKKRNSFKGSTPDLPHNFPFDR